MTDPISQIAALVAAWNDATGQSCNAMAYERRLLPIVMCPATYPTDCLAIVARYIKRMNSMASEAKYRKPLNLARIVDDFGEFDSLYQLATAWARNQVRPSAKAAFVDSLPVTLQTHGIKQADTGNTTLARQAVADGLRKLSTEIAKGN